MKKTDKIIVLIVTFVLLVSCFGLQSVAMAGGEQTADGETTLGTAKLLSAKKGVSNGHYKADTGISYIFDNLLLTSFLSTKDCGNGYATDGKNNYYFAQSVESLKSRYSYYDGKGVSVIAQILLPWTSNSVMKNLIYPSGRQSGHSYYALNASTSGASQALTQIFQHLVKGMPEVTCWVIGNEVNYEGVWNYCGKTDTASNATIASQSFDCMYAAIQKCGSAAKAAICLDMCWNPSNIGAGTSLASWIRSKDFLTAFANIEKKSNHNWQLAFHPYPVPAPKGANPANWCLWSANCAPYQTFKDSTPFITGANLYVLTDYIRKNWGSGHHVFLTEFGYDYHQGAKAQAAQLYYTYKAAERNSMIDACIYQWNNSADAGDGRDMGMFNADGSAREIYNVFRYMNISPTSANESKYLSYLSSVTGASIKSWQQNISYGTKGSMQPSDPNPTPTPTPTPEPTIIATSIGIKRYAGANRYETAVLAARAAFPNGPETKTAILVSGENFPDALAASGLAGAAECPLIMTAKDSLPSASSKLIKEWGITSVTIIGGTDTVSAAVETQLGSAGVQNVSRIAGKNRYQTASQIFRNNSGAFLSNAKAACVIVSGEVAADALSMSPWAYAYGMPVFLTKSTATEQELLEDAAHFQTAYIAGGTSSVSQETEDALKAEGVTAVRLAGSSRYSTSQTIAKTFLADCGGTFDGSVFAAGQGSSFVDALAGCMVAGSSQKPLLLVNGEGTSGTNYPAATKTKTTSVIIMGGNNALSVNTLNAILTNWK